jgi:hypothetical protein
MNLRKVKQLMVSTELLLQLLGPHPACGAVSVVSDGIPADAEIRSIRLNFLVDTVELLLASEDFPEVPPGEAIPFLCPIYRSEAIGI